jgi:hypothetical protein
MKHFTIHIFGYGETQINGDDFSVKVKTDTLTKITPLVEAIWDLKPADSQAQRDFHAINIFSYNDFRYMSKNGFGDKVTDDLKVLIDDLIAELKVIHDATTTPAEPTLVEPTVDNTVTPPADEVVTPSADDTTTPPADEVVTPPAPNTDAPTS